MTVLRQSDIEGLKKQTRVFSIRSYLTLFWGQSAVGVQSPLVRAVLFNT